MGNKEGSCLPLEGSGGLVQGREVSVHATGFGGHMPE